MRIRKLSHPYLHYWPELWSPTLKDKTVKGPGYTELKPRFKDLYNSGSYFICFKNDVPTRKSLPCLGKNKLVPGPKLHSLLKFQIGKETNNPNAHGQ